MATRELIKSIFFDEIINEAKLDEVRININGEENVFNVGFNSCIEGVLDSGNFGDSKPILMVNNTEQMITLLEQYYNECNKYESRFENCKLEEKIKIFLTLLWSNATYEDFANPLLYIRKRIDFYQNKLFDFDSITYSDEINALDDSKIIINNSLQDIRQETPYVFKPIIEKEEYSYSLPHISYGISNGECYIYAIQKEKHGELDSYQKKINRKLYKINDGVRETETEEYNEYLSGDEYYPENISDVTPAAILSLTIFLDMLNRYGVDKVKVISLLPIRYNSKEQAFTKKYEYKLKYQNLSDIELKKLLLEYKKENLRIQMNLTEKMIRNFRRIEYHFENCKITSFPMEFDEYLHMNVREFTIGNNNFLNEVMNLKKLDIYK